MDIVSQLYGLSFVFLGVLILFWPRHEDEFSFARTLRFLGGFGLTHGFIEWMDLWRETHGATPLLDTTEPFVLLFSYLFLFEFGRRLIRSGLSPQALSSIPGYLSTPWIYLLALGAIPLGASNSGNGPQALTLLSQSIVGFSGAVLTVTGFFIYWHRYVKRKLIDTDNKLIKIAFYVLAVSFIAYGVLGGLLVPPDKWFTASRFNDELFRVAFHFPARIGRVLSTVLAAISLIYILRVFYAVAREGLIGARTVSTQGRKSPDRASLSHELLLRNAGDGIHVFDMEGNVVEANDAFCRMLGYTREEVLGMNVSQWDAQCSTEEIKQKLSAPIDKPLIFEARHRRGDGKIIDVEISAVVVQVDDKPLLCCSSRDITDRRRDEEQLRLIARAFDSVAEGVMITDEKQNILMVNDSFTAATGYAREEAIGKTPAILQSGKQGRDFYKKMWEALRDGSRWQGEIWNRRKNGELYLEWLSINTVRNEEGGVINYVGMFSGITLIKESRQRMEFLATHDELTKLPNRTLFNDHLRLALARSARTDGHLALLFVDLDNFKMINDTLGHEEGDALLKQVAGRLKGCVREADTVARLGGDEFVILLEIEHRDRASITAKRIIESFSASFWLKEQEYFISSSIGISLFPEDGSEPKLLMRHADTAMYRAKERGKNTYMFFTKEMSEQISRRMRIESALRQAIPNNELVLQYQPLIDLRNYELVGVEALVRWRHDGETILPGTFIPAAEESGLIVDIDCWVVGEACRQMRLWEQSELPPFWVSINISARHFSRPNLFSRIMGIAALAKIPPSRLSIEITESSLMDVESASRMLQKLHEAGFRVSVDDFGTGFSSLSYLKRFPIHELKIDRSFIDGIATDPEDRSITTAIIAMARELGLKTVAEGVETQAQHETLKNLGCDIGQGYLYSKPMPAAIFQDWLLNRGGEKIARSGR